MSSNIKDSIESFHTALKCIRSESESKSHNIDGYSDFEKKNQKDIFNLPSELYNFLKLTPNSNDLAHKCKGFSEVKEFINIHFQDLIEILKNVTLKSNLKIILKHLQEMLYFIPSFGSLIKPLLKILVNIWSNTEAAYRSVTSIAFNCILHLAQLNNKANLEETLKMMHIIYEKNTLMVSSNNLPGIDFMRNSLVKIYLLDSNLAYTYAFFYIRQLAVQLRDAKTTIKMKKNPEEVYNWQFINSLKFWSELLPAAEDKSMLKELIYPLVQIINTTITLVPTVQYYPLRFHCIQMLIDISKNTGLFIPSIAYVLDVLSSYDFSKKHTSNSMKPISLVYHLRISKKELFQNGNLSFSIIENVYRLILENAVKDSNCVYFPEVYTQCIIQLKSFLEKNHLYGKQMKQLLHKIEENVSLIDKERGKVALDLKNISEIKNWENRMKTDGTPISKAYESLTKVYSKQLKNMSVNTVKDLHTSDLKKSISTKKGIKRKAACNGDSEHELPVQVVDKMRQKQRKLKKQETE